MKMLMVYNGLKSELNILAKFVFICSFMTADKCQSAGKSVL